jgi:predicted Fe-Mo cluster-binding NifX family protein
MDIDDRFGRARGFFIIDEENGSTRFIDNTNNVDADHGAGPAAVQKLVEAGVGVLLTGRVGPKAADALKAAGIGVINVEAGHTVEETWKACKDKASEE